MESVELEIDVAMDAPVPTAAGTLPPHTPPPPTSSSQLDALRAIAHDYRSAQAWEELAQTLRRIIDLGRLEDTLGEQETFDLFTELARVEGDVLGRVDEAIGAWREVLAIDASDLAALTSLETLFVRVGQWEDSIDILEKRALVLDDDAARRDALLQAAATYEEHLGDFACAAAIYERVRGSDPANQLACERLDAIYTEQREWTQLVELLLERSELVAGAAKQIALLARVAQIYEAELDEPESAFYVLQAAFNRDRAHAPTARELERLATATRKWQELLDEYTAHATELEHTDHAAAAALWVNIGRWYGEHLSQADHASQSLQHALELDPSHSGALAAIADLQRDRGDWGDLADTLQRRADVEPDALERAKLFVALGDLYDRHANDGDAAARSYEQALAAHPDARAAMPAAALHVLELLYARTNQNDKYVDMLTAQLDVATTDDDRVSLYERLAAAWHERFSRLDRAAEALESLLALDRRHLTAYSELAAIYQQTKSWEQLVDTYRNHVLATDDRRTRGYLYVELGAAYEAHLSDVAAAIDAYASALDIDPDDARALDAVARLYEKTGDWERAIDAMSRLVDAATETAKQVELHTRIGKLQYAQLRNGGAAEARLLRALELDGAHIPAMTALAKQYSDRGDWARVVDMMTRAESHTRVVVDKVRLLFGIAALYRDRLRDPEAAQRYLALVISHDPEHVEAGRPLADVYEASADWTALSPIVEMLVRKAVQHGGDPRALADLLARAARCARELGDHARALQHYQRALELDPTHVPTLLARADLLFQKQDWDAAAKVYQTVLLHHRDVDVYSRLGKIRRALGERDKALAMFDKALELDRDHRDTLQAIAELHGERRDWDAVVVAKRGLVAVAPAAEKVELLVEIGGILEKRLARGSDATAAYQEALAHAPEDRRLLQKLLDLHTAAKQWRQVVDTIRRFVALEDDLHRKGSYFQAAATVCRDELAALDEAVELYNGALDCFFAQPERLDEQQLARALRSFEAIDKVLTTKRDWHAQEQAYLKLIKRLPETAAPHLHKLQVFLFDGLAEIYRSRLKHYDSAASAFEIAHKLDPDNELRLDGADRAEILAELYVVAGPSHADKAIAAHRQVIAKAAFTYDSYKALARIYRDTQQHDKYWCVANTLRFLKKADADDLAFVDQYKPRGVPRAKHPMSNESWARMATADENRHVTAILAACGQGVAAMNAFSHKDLGLKREDRRQLELDQLMFSKLFLHVAGTLSVPLPEVYLVDDNKAAEFQLANAIVGSELCPSLVVRPQQFQGKSEREVAFLCARKLASMRGEYYLRALLPTTTELGVAALAAIVLVQPGYAVPAALAETVGQYLAKLKKKVPAHALEQLGVAVQRFVKSGTQLDAPKWAHAVDAVAQRAGFVVCGDLDVAARVIAVESVSIGGPPVKDKVKDLVLFSISEELFAIRAQMGLGVAKSNAA